MNRNELEARVMVLERLVISLLRRLEFADRIDADDVEAIIAGIHGEGDTPAVEYVVRHMDRLFPPPGTESKPVTMLEAIQDWKADVAERRRVFGPDDE
jgi:hypothetical protein